MSDFLPAPGDAPAIRWGILGAGGIARKFADAVTRHTAAEVVAVASHTPGKAQAFAAEKGIPQWHDSYAELVQRDDIDAVYVATTHNNHHEPAMLAIEHGKAVLVEKAFTQNLAQAQQVLAAAATHSVYVQEAMWTRFLPHMVELRRQINAGAIGEVVAVHADHSQAISHVPRLMRPELAGGALLDLGVYPISFAYDILGKPREIRSIGAFTETGVDGQVTMAFQYEGRAQASLATSLWTAGSCAAVVHGTAGRIEIDRIFYAPSKWRLVRNDGTRLEFDGQVDNGFQFQAAEVARNLRAGRTESAVIPWQHTLDVMEIMDQVRNQIGLVYPTEK